jgi:inner membrane protein
LIIGHIPAGYLLAHGLHQWRLISRAADRTAVFLAVLVGSVFPDIDLLYFYLLDHRAHHHHTYWTHLPVFWVGLLSLGLVTMRLIPHREGLALTGVFALSIMLHLALDSSVGDIWWLYPVIDKPFSPFTVPVTQPTWLLSFVFHSSFLLELAVTLLATAVYFRHPGSARHVPW